MAWLLVSFFAYMAFILAVGVVAGRRTGGRMESFYLGDRKVGAWVTAISASASSESGWLVMGCVMMGYVYGVAAYWITIGCVLGFAFNWFFFAERVRRLSAETDSLTVPELLETLTDDRTRLVRPIGVLIILVLMFFYVAAQLTAAGVALEAVLSWPYWVGVLIGAAVTIFYTTVGGYRAVSWTDLFQGLLMAAALLVIPLLAYSAVGGAGALKKEVLSRPAQEFHVFKGFVGDEYRVVRVEPGHPGVFANPDDVARSLVLRAEPGPRFFVEVDGGAREPLGAGADGVPTLDMSRLGLTGSLALDKTYQPVGGDAFFAWTGGMLGLVLLGWIVEMLGIGLGYPGSPHVVARFMAARSRTEIVRGRAIALTWAVLAEGGAISMGILARGLFPDLADPQAGLLEGARYFLHPVLVGLILAAVFAALRSTADSQLLVASSAVVRDLCGGVLRMRLTDEKAMRISRVVVLVLGLLALALALGKNRLIFWFVLFAWAGLGASFAPSLILSVWWKRLSGLAVACSMLAGFGTTFLWKLRIRPALKESLGLDLYELVPAFLVALAVAVLVSWASPRRTPDGLNARGESPPA